MAAPSRNHVPRSSRARTAVAIACAVLLAGCGGEGGSGPQPTPSGAATPSPAPTPTATPAPTPPSDPFTIAAAIPAGLAPGVAWGGGSYLVAYADRVDRADPDLVGVRLSQIGVVLDAKPLFLSDLGAEPILDPADATYSSPALAFDGTRFAVYFFGGGTAGAVPGLPAQVVAFVPVTVAGEVLGPAAQIAAAETFSMAAQSLSTPIAAAAASGRSVALFPHEQAVPGTGDVLTSVLGAFLTVASDGAIERAGVGNLTPDVPPPLGDVVADASPPGVATTGAMTLGAWVETRISVAPPHEGVTQLRGALITPGGTPQLLALSSASVGSAGTAVASDGADFLVVWTSTASPGGPSAPLTEVRGLRYRPGAGALDPDGGFLIAGGDAAKSLGGVAFAGGAYLAVWGEAGEVRGAAVLPDGTVRAPVAIGDGSGSEPAVAGDGERFLVVFDRGDGAAVDLMGSFVAAE